MKTQLLFLALISVFILSACAPVASPTTAPTSIPVVASPTPAPTLPAPSATPAPTAAPTAVPAPLRLVVFTSDQAIQMVDTQFLLGSSYNPAFTGFLPAGDASAGTAYVIDFTSPFKAMAVDAKGFRDLVFIHNPNYGLALWHGGPNTQPRLAWGTQLTNDAPSSLLISNPDGSHLETLLTLPTTPQEPVQLLAEAWSADGQTLYFSKEPVGIGGYILFDGASNLYAIDISTKKVTEIIPQRTSSSAPLICLDALSANFRLVADHCTAGVITVRNLASHTSAVIQPPAGVKGFHAMGSARFSPDGKQVAFALGVRDPSAEQGWVAVASSAGGASKLILTGQPGLGYTVRGWLDDKTLLVQSNPVNCTADCGSKLWQVALDGSAPVKLADGSLLAVVDNR